MSHPVVVRSTICFCLLGHWSELLHQCPSQVSSMAIIRIRDRAISTQRCNKIWLAEPSAGPSNHSLMKKIGYFTTQSPICGSKKPYFIRNSNPSAFRQICGCESCEPVHDDASILDCALGGIAIEIQQFLRCSVMVQGATSSDSCSLSAPGAPSKLLVE
ncbi:MAG: hypothetical protein BYD32DRAFT_103396 [Podila humilis]|nr:MAG: hypothetical protein BYD32DRAFT_103396 [Podila humilis]